MLYWKTIVCLANSRKLGGRCVAGRLREEAGYGPWIRLVSGQESGKLSVDMVRYRNGAEVRVCDVIGVPIVRRVRHAFQKENFLIATGETWKFLGRIGWNEVLSLAEDGLSSPVLEHDKGAGGTRRVSLERARKLSQSLCLVRVGEVRLRIGASESADHEGRAKLRARFGIGSKRYDLSVTDPQVENMLVTRGEGRWKVHDAVLCISLTEPLDGFCYRVVASIITKRRCDAEQGH